MRFLRMGFATWILAAVASAGRAGDDLDALNTKVGEHLGKDDFAEATSVVATLEATEAAAQAALQSGEAAEAVRLRRLVLAGWENARGRDGMETIAARSNLAHALHAAGDVAGAEQAFEETLRALERRGMEESAESAAVRSNLGTMIVRRGEYARGLAALEAALATYVRIEGRDAPAVPTIRSNIAGAKMKLGRNEEALAECREIVASWERTAGPDDPLTLTAVNNLANVLVQMQRSAEAVPLLERVTIGLRKTMPPNNPNVLSAGANLAAVYRLVGRGADAVRIGETTLAEREKFLPPGHTDIGDSLGNLADALMFRGDVARAVTMTDRGQRANRIRDARILPALTDAEQLTFLEQHTRPELEQALNVALQARSVPDAVARAAGWLANAKGRAVEAAAARMQVARSQADPRNAARIAELMAVRTKMAMLVQATPAGVAGDRIDQQLEALADRERVVVRDLGIATAAADSGAWVPAETIRAAIPQDAVLVDIARFARLDFKVTAAGRRVYAARYAAWVVPPAGAGDVRVIDLGPADAIDAAVTACREAIEDVEQGDVPQDEATAEASFREAATPLAEKVLRPILDGIGPADEIIVVPDGMLWLVPWQALPLGDGSYAIERFAIRTLTSGRDLVPAVVAETERKPSAPLIFADPDFDALPPGIRPAPGKTVAAGRIEKAKALPATRREAESARAPLASLAGVDPVVRVGSDAAEGLVKKEAVRPRALLMATHGLFLPDQPTHPGAMPSRLAARGVAGTRPLAAPVTADPAAGPLDPLLRCGLLFTGANLTAAGQSLGDDDGILTGAEIVGLDLLGTDLVVLSACETGVGKVQNGEGVAGLRQAFQIAGAKCVVATLWHVPDEESEQIMRAFYANLAEHQPASKALREAQLAFINARRQDRDRKAAHPYLWAAYGVTGR